VRFDNQAVLAVVCASHHSAAARET